jgi:hypothetical protein
MLEHITKFFLGEKRQCGHGRFIKSSVHKVTVLGIECSVASSDCSKLCAEEYLNKFSTLCAECEEPILPGDPVGQAWEDASHPYTHMRCAQSAALFCGKWGEGRLISLHEMNPARYPALSLHHARIV